MKKTLLLFSLLGCLLAGGAALGQTITSFTPLSAKPGDAVTITGTGFNTTAANNIVFFGATQATVTAATATSMTATVPTGATYAPISVLNTATVLSAESRARFNPIYAPAKTSLTTADFLVKIDFTTGTSPFSAAVGDLDGDGKPDLVTANSGTGANSISVFRNTGSSGSITASSFAAKTDFTTGSKPYSVAIGDLDGDGKPDLAVANNTSNSVSVFRNTSTSSSISFADKTDFATGNGPRSVTIGDLDGDGKPDLATANTSANSVSVLRNTNTSGGITSSSFALKTDFTTGTEPTSVVIGDLDGDDKPDLATANQTGTVSVLRNTTSTGSISFAAKTDFTTGSSPQSLAIGDLDGDGKPDLTTANYSSDNVSVLRNTGTGTTPVSFAAKTDFTTGDGPYSVAVGDLDGDGKPDLATANLNTSNVSILRNTGTTTTPVSFAAKTDFTSGTGSASVAIGDLDGDGKPDLATANYSSNTVSVFRNAGVITVIGTPTAFTACSGTASAQQNFTVSGSNLTANITVTAPTGFEVSSGSGFSNSVTFPQSSGSVATTTIYVRMAALTASPTAANVTVTSTGATTRNVAVSGTVNVVQPTITLGTINSIPNTATSFTIPVTATTGSPNQYSISTGSPLAMPSFVAVTNATLSGSINVPIPASANNTYNFDLTVRNSTTTCVSSVQSFALTVREPSPAAINLKGNGNSIANNAGTPSLNNYTDFGTLNVALGTRTYNFSIENTGEAALTLSGTPIVSITGAHAADFTVLTQPASTTVGGLSTTHFELRFDPSAGGIRTATVSIANSTGSPYTFGIQGTGDATPIAEQFPYMVADLVPSIDPSTSAGPRFFVVIGNKMYFSTNSPLALWETDGTAAGTKRIQTFTSTPFPLINLNGTLYFAASTSANGSELYKYDGTTLTLIEIIAGTISSSIGNLTDVNGTLYFSATSTTNTSRRQLYKLDGNLPVAVSPIGRSATANFSNLTFVNGVLYFRESVTPDINANLYKYDGTNLATLIAINPTVGAHSEVRNLTKVNNTLYFTATDGTSSGLYSYDGTTPTLIAAGSYDFLTNVNGTLYYSGAVSGGNRLHKYDGITVTPISPTFSGFASNITGVGSNIYFSQVIASGFQAFSPIALYRYDGTGTDATLIMGSGSSPSPSRPVGANLTDLNGTLFFTANTTDNGAELYRYDGTTATLIDINSGANSSNPTGLQNINGLLYFQANNETTGTELYTHDGTTLTMIDIASGTGWSSPRDFTIFNGHVYFSATTPANGSEVWKTNGTQAGTQLLKDVAFTIGSGEPNQMTDVNGTLYFGANTPNNGFELYKYDGTNTTFIDINVGTGGSNPDLLTNINGTLYFRATTLDNGRELFKYDGSNLTLIDVSEGSSSSGPSNFTNVNGTLYFTASTSTGDFSSRTELYKYDGTTLTLVNINTGTNSSEPYYLTNVNGILYFTANTPANGRELYKYDGTTLTLVDINSGTNGSTPSNLTNVNGILYFTATTPANGLEPYKYDGTTLTLVDINPGINGSTPSNLTNANGTLYLRATASANGTELYKYDGTTLTLVDVNVGIGNSNPANLTNVNGTLYFNATTSANGTELYKYDGTTLTLVSINSGSASSSPSNLTNVNGTLYFSATTSANGVELYRYEGTGNTATLLNINSGTGNSDPSSFIHYDNSLYFAADNGTSGIELFKTDGTPAGTKIVKDIQLGSSRSEPNGFAISNNKLFFNAGYTPTDSTYGEELWTLGNCKPINSAVVSAGTNVSFNTEQQAGPSTQSCHCDVFNKLITTIDATGASPVSGEVSSKVWIDAAANAAYVKRHYEITPASNPTTATGRVTLYFTQAEFDAFNTLNSASELPSSSTDAAGKANLRIRKYNGTSNNGTGAENTYAGSATIIDPADADIVWNATASRWEVSFATTGFGGYFVGNPAGITNFPATACVGSSISITGVGFTGATALSVGSVNATNVVVVSNTQITAVINSAASGTISITTPNGVITSTGTMTVNNVPTVPTISGPTKFCEGDVTTLTASSSVQSTVATTITYHWRGGLTGSSLSVSPVTTQSYRVIAKANGCSSDSSAVFTLTVFPKPAIPTITASSMQLCKGESVQLTGTCSATTDIFRWTTPPLLGNSVAALSNINRRTITTPGVYKGLCESKDGCTSSEVSIDITERSDCNGLNFITVTPSKTAICPGGSVQLTAAGCAGGTLTWYGGAVPQTGTSITASPTVSTTYVVQCSTGGLGTVDVVVAQPTVAVPNNIVTGQDYIKATQTITSDKKIGDAGFTPAPSVLYEAGSSITLLPGFVAERWSTFKAEIKGCN